MTRRAEDPIRRRPDGSIDYLFYDRRARRIRSADFSGFAARMIGLGVRR